LPQSRHLCNEKMFDIMQLKIKNSLLSASESGRDLETGSETFPALIFENTRGLITITVRIKPPASMFSAWMLGFC